MKNKKIGFIGAGNMAKAIIGGIVNSHLVPAKNVYASNRTEAKLVELKQEFGITIATDNKVIAKTCDIVFLSVTPEMYEKVIEEIKASIKDNAIIILIAAGQSIEQNEQRFQRPVKIVKAMPNTPVLVGEGMTAISTNALLTAGEKEDIQKLFESFGKAAFIDESLMDVVTATSGSSPAYVYQFIEALADGAVMHGLPRKDAYLFAAQAVLGAAKMVLETGIHPGELKDQVCSPGGTTIESIATLEKHGMRYAIIDAIAANINKSRSIH
ncbi:pyrroline-5-carboxylate reductase [Caldibacillus lycopersici]|uniref:Pyrroline-5-carboxylate reductase n=1 Tax=Perspicuibacillus lycopersici TaxID=1325689 RepID=A0AAE3IW22_9BACI|nr:pyrroline-5-carboxylate reductase [Perspicuibacillus lycopersici]MCU9614449.1 pyrroline-5-carboxylate reductase [Perspicuibacillus lycopersici]